MPAPGLSRNSPGPVLENSEKTSRVRYPNDAPDQAVADPVTAWARSELAYRKLAAGDARPSSAMRGHIEIPGFTLVETVEATIVR